MYFWFTTKSGFLFFFIWRHVSINDNDTSFRYHPWCQLSFKHSKDDNFQNMLTRLLSDISEDVKWMLTYHWSSTIHYIINDIITREWKTNSIIGFTWYNIVMILSERYYHYRYAIKWKMLLKSISIRKQMNFQNFTSKNHIHKYVL